MILNKTRLVLGLVFPVLACVVLGFAEGARRIYSGGFFLLLGLILLLGWRRSVTERDSTDPTRADEPLSPGERELKD